MMSHIKWLYKNESVFINVVKPTSHELENLFISYMFELNVLTIISSLKLNEISFHRTIEFVGLLPSNT